MLYGTARDFFLHLQHSVFFLKLAFKGAMDASEGAKEPVTQKGPLPAPMLWVEQLRKYVGSGEGLGSEAATGWAITEAMVF